MFAPPIISLISNSRTWRGLTTNCSRLRFRSFRSATAYPFLVVSYMACAAADSHECPGSDSMASKYCGTASRSPRPPLSTSSNPPPPPPPPCSRSQVPQPKASDSWHQCLCPHLKHGTSGGLVQSIHFWLFLDQNSRRPSTTRISTCPLLLELAGWVAL